RRRRVAELRRSPDRELRQMQVSATRRLAGEVLAAGSRAFRGGERLHRRQLGQAIGSVSVLCVLWLAGARNLVLGTIPTVGRLAPFAPVHSLLGWYVAWPYSHSVPGPPGSALLGIAGLALFGNVELLRKLIVLAVLPLGALGMWRVSGRAGTLTARLVSVGAYAAVPLALRSLSRGNLEAVVMYMAAPFLLNRLLPAELGAPRRRTGHGGPRRARSGVLAAGTDAAKLALLIALVAAFVPSAAFIVATSAVGLALGGVAAVRTLKGTGRFALVTTAALVIAVAVLSPYALQPATLSAALSHARPGASLLGLLSLSGGRVVVPGLALVAAGGLVLAIGAHSRLGLALRAWSSALVLVITAWVGSIFPGLPVGAAGPADAMAAAGIALAVGLGAAAFEIDLPRHRLGWHHAGSLVAAGALCAAVVPLLGAGAEGSFGMPAHGLIGQVSWLAGGRPGAPNVLWIGPPRALPVSAYLPSNVASATGLAAHAPGGTGGPASAAGDRSLAYGFSSGAPTVVDGFPGPVASTYFARSGGGGPGLPASVAQAVSGQTVTLGGALRASHIAYVGVVLSRAPGLPAVSGYQKASAALVRGLSSQLDMRRLPGDASMAVFETVPAPGLGTGGAVPLPPAGSARVPGQPATRIAWIVFQAALLALLLAMAWVSSTRRPRRALSLHRAGAEPVPSGAFGARPEVVGATRSRAPVPRPNAAPTGRGPNGPGPTGPGTPKRSRHPRVPADARAGGGRGRL
ncbi:MAG: hypothetical protein ACYDH5_11340, partial [Acidimicrobiales bacterium]